jgi:hypothetical protein
MENTVLLKDLLSSHPNFSNYFETNPTEVSTPRRNRKLNSFYQSPFKDDSNSTVRVLKQCFGKESNGIQTFQTDYISTQSLTSYNGLKFILEVKNYKVLLNLVCDDVLTPVCIWTIETLLKSLNKKNDGLVSQSELLNLLIDGKLRVKFNVSRTKDHGTKWSFQNRVTVPIQKIVQTNEVNEEVIEDFFSDF